MPALILEVFRSRLAPGELALTLNIPADELRHFLNEEHGCCFRSRDEDALPGENAKRNVERVYEAIGVASPEQFVSLALRTGDDGSSLSTTLRDYGTVVLELDLDRLGREVIIFNGDVKNLGAKLAQERDTSWVSQIPWDDDRAVVARALTALVENSRRGQRPRRLGNYFEARLPRAMRLNDIARVYVDPRDEAAVRVARLLCG